MLTGKALMWAVGLLAAAILIIGNTIRARAVNRHDPLQDRLAEHFERYLAAPDAAALEQLTLALRKELKDRQVPRTEWRFRLFSAVNLVETKRGPARPTAMATAESIANVIERLGSPT